WRWQRQRDDSPWYPSIRLFRQHARGDWDDVFARLTEALRERARDKPSRSAPVVESAEEHHQVGHVHLRQNRVDKALQCFQEAEKRNPHVPGLDNSLGVALARLKRLDEAAARFGQALQREPGNPALLGNLATAHLERGKPAEAEGCLRQLVVQ